MAYQLFQLANSQGFLAFHYQHDERECCDKNNC